MRVRRLESRVDGVIRWLERMKQSYSSGKVETACMDVECARADLEDLRTDIFAGITPRRKDSITAMFARMSALSVMIVMMTAVPLSREKLPPIIDEALIQPPKAEVPVKVIPPAPEAVRQQQPPKSRKPSQALKRPTKTASKPKPEPKPSPVKSPAYDKVYSLVQTGQRALKDDKSVIKVK